MSQNKVTTAVIPAAGLGTRFLPFTKSQPKEMLPIVDKPAIQYVVEEAVRAGITDILMITGRGKRAIEDHFDRNFELDVTLLKKGKIQELETLEEIESLANIHYIRQRDANGLGHAISVARHHVGPKAFAVMLGDDIMVDDSKLLKDMIADYQSEGSSVIGLMKVDPQSISSYGCATIREDLDQNLDSQRVQVTGVEEKPAIEDAKSNLAVIGRYVFTPEIFDYIENIEPGFGGEIQLTDAISELIKNGKVFGRTFTHGRYDVGQKADWLIANIEIALMREDLSEQIKSKLISILNQGSPK